MPVFKFILFCIFSFSMLILLWYYLYYFARVAFYRKKKYPAADSALPPASVIICAKNEDHNLPEFLPLVLSQDYPEYEVVVVDDGSWDNTALLLKEFSKKFPHLKIVTIKEDEKHPHGKKFALMVGIKGARHESLLLTDADCKPLTNLWLKEMMQNFSEEKKIVLGYSQYEKNGSLLNQLIRFDAFQIALQYFSFAMAGKPYMGVGRNLAYAKNLFFQHKGFASHYHIESGDDDLFVQQAATRSNTAVEFSPGSFTASKAKKTWKGWVEQKRRHLSTAGKYKPGDKFRLALYPFAQFLFWLSFAFLLVPHPLPVFSEYDLYIVLCLLAVRLIVQNIVLKTAMNKLKEQDLFVISFPCEIFFLFFYPALLVSNLLFKRKSWKRN